jgi:hypothetical protein
MPKQVVDRYHCNKQEATGAGWQKPLFHPGFWRCRVFPRRWDFLRGQGLGARGSWQGRWHCRQIFRLVAGNRRAAEGTAVAPARWPTSKLGGQVGDVAT